MTVVPLPTPEPLSFASHKEHLRARLELVRLIVADALESRDPQGNGGPRGLFVTHGQAQELVRTVTSAGPSVSSALGDVESAAEVAEADGVPLRLRLLKRVFGLDAFEEEVLLLAVAPELDARFQRLYGYLHDDLTRRRLSVGLALELTGSDLLDGDRRARLLPEGALIRGGLLSVDSATGTLLSAEVVVPQRVVQFLLDDDAFDHDLVEVVREPPPSSIDLVDTLTRAIEGGSRLLALRERVAGTAAAAAAAAYSRLGFESLWVDASDVPDDRLATVTTAALREARLRGVALILGPTSRLAQGVGGPLATLLRVAWPTVLVDVEAWDPRWSDAVPLCLDVPLPLAAERRAVWKALLGDECGIGVPDVLRLGPLQVKRAHDAAVQHAIADGSSLAGEHLRRGVRAQNSPALATHARLVEPRVGWDELVLPPDVLEILHDLVARRRLRDEVYARLGVRRGNEAVTAMFCGEPGTGKSMAAEVLGRELGLDCYVIDLAKVIDKYIGETEKKLDRIFNEAESVNGILVFDEADALFGKRSEVKDAHDRYANVEVAYLLQRIESFDGMAVLTSNLAKNLDEAFSRRLDAIVEFPMPEPPQRLLLWQGQLARITLGEDVDLEFCARAFPITGGHIRNAAVGAAFLAAREEGDIAMRHVIRAIAREYRKLGRLCLESDFGAYYEWAAR